MQPRLYLTLSISLKVNLSLEDDKAELMRRLLEMRQREERAQQQLVQMVHMR